MKSFQPRAGDTPPDDDPGRPPGPEATTEDHPEPAASETDPETGPETGPMPRASRRNRNAEVDFRGATNDPTPPMSP